MMQINESAFECNHKEYGRERINRAIVTGEMIKKVDACACEYIYSTVRVHWEY